MKITVDSEIAKDSTLADLVARANRLLEPKGCRSDIPVIALWCRATPPADLALTLSDDEGAVAVGSWPQSELLPLTDRSFSSILGDVWLEFLDRRSDIIRPRLRKLIAKLEEEDSSLEESVAMARADITRLEKRVEDLERRLAAL